MPRDELQVIDAPGHQIESMLAELDQDAVRYYLAAGAGEFERPLWAFPAKTGPDRRSTLSLVEDVLHRREGREAAIEDEVAALGSWLAEDIGSGRTLVAELFGSATRDQISFLRACGQRLSGCRGGLRIMVLRHRPGARPRPAGPETDEILLTLLLAGGHASETDLWRWARLRGWDPAQVAAVTAARPGGLRTYADVGLWSRATTTRRHVEPAKVSDLAAMVITARPSVATAVLVRDPAAAVAALRRDGAAASTPAAVAALCRMVLHDGHRDRWTRVDRATAYSLYLAAFVATRRRIAPATADRVLCLAERTGVLPEVRSLLAYHLGQLLAKDTMAAAWAASMRHFAYARERAGVSRVAATYNGEALALFRSGDHDGAARAELVGLESLAAAGASAGIPLAEQRVLLLVNLAEVYGRNEATKASALDCCREALRVATDADSLVALTYVVPSMVRRLLDAGLRTEAEKAAKRLLHRYDGEIAPRRAAERAVVSGCCRLAHARLAEGAASSAAAWYLQAARRMRRAAPESLDGMLRNLRAHTDAPIASVIERLDAELAVHRAAQARLTPLANLRPRR